MSYFHKVEVKVRQSPIAVDATAAPGHSASRLWVVLVT